MEDIVDVESELTQRLSGLQKRLEKVAHPDLTNRGDLGKVHELIKANLQRSKVIQDQIKESKVYFGFEAITILSFIYRFSSAHIFIRFYIFRHTHWNYLTIRARLLR